MADEEVHIAAPGEEDHFPSWAEKMTDAQKKRDHYIGGLKQQNMNMLLEMAQAGARPNDLGIPRVEAMMEYLIEAGIITMDQRLEEQEKWEKRLRSELQPAVTQIREALRQMGQDQRLASGLIVPGAGNKVNGG